MSTLAAALAAQTKRPSVRCAIAVLYERLDEGDARALRSALSDSSVEASAIFRALAEEGHKVGLSSVSRHRRRDCNCDAL